MRLSYYVGKYCICYLMLDLILFFLVVKLIGLVLTETWNSHVNLGLHYNELLRKKKKVEYCETCDKVSVPVTVS